MGINERATDTKQRPSGNTAGAANPSSGRCDAGFKGLRSAHKQRSETPGQQAREPWLNPANISGVVLTKRLLTMV